MRKALILFAVMFSVITAQAEDRLPRRAWIGAGFQPISDSLRGQMPDSAGARVVFLPDGPARAAGIEMGDIVLTIDGKPVRTGPQIAAMVKENYHAGQTVAAELRREGMTPLSKNVTLVEFLRENPGDFDVIYDSFEMDGALRRMIITKPRAAGKFPTVVMFGGLGCYSLDNPTGLLNSYNEILYALTRAGFATVRIEKTGMGDSQGIPCSEQDFDYEVRGLVTGMQYAATLPYIDRDNMIIFGHSMGGLTGPVAAGEYPVKGIVAMATSAIGWFEYMLINQRRQLVLEGLPYDSIEAAQAHAERAYHLLYVEKQPLDSILKDHPDYDAYLQAPAHYTFMQDVGSLNPSAVWKKVDAKVLFIYGTSDFVTAANEHTYGVDVVNSYHPGHAEYAQIDDLDHFFIRTPDQQSSFDNLAAGTPNRKMNRDVIPVITRWCRQLVGMDARRAVER